MNCHSKTALLALLTLGALAAAAGAKTLSVENNGVDGPNCGGKLGACRSISRAIGNAAAGDRILVGPGVYGDIDGDNAFTSPGDEAAQVDFGCHCMVRVHKAVTVVSAQGASATTLSAGNAPFESLVTITAGDATFGEQDKGFFVSASPFEALTYDGVGIRTTAATAGVKIGGNVVLNTVTGFQLYGSGHLVEHNRAAGNHRGFAVLGDEMTLQHNVAMGNEDGIVVGAASAWLESNAVIGNRIVGVALLRGQEHHVRHSAVLGNPGGGVQVDTFCPGTLCKNVNGQVNLNDIYGNGGAGNCGIINAKNLSLGTLEARGNYWGRPGGPGADPGDTVCNLGASTSNGAIQTYPAELVLDIAPQH